MGYLVSPEVPFVFAFLVTQVTFDTFALCVNIDNVLFQIEFVAEDPITNRTDARLSAVPKFGNTRSHQKLSVWK